MDLLINFGLFAISLLVLLKASDFFIDSAERIGLSLGISPFIIGVTIVAFGTSLPELASSIVAVFAGESAIVAGNVIGSNITNIALVLGLTAVVVKEINIVNDIWKIDLPYLWGSSFLLYFMLMDLEFSVFEALICCAGIVIFLTYSFFSDSGAEEEETEKSKIDWKVYPILLLSGFFVYLGAEYTVKYIIEISSSLGINSGIIAQTVVALGTSLPEVVVSLMAARKGKASIAIGNVLGSNIFNTYAVMGIPGLIGNLTIPAEMTAFSLPLMIAMTIIFGVMCISRNISRWEGMLLLLFYSFFLIESFL